MDISLMSRPQCTHTKNPCPGHNSPLPCWIWIIFHTIVVHDPKVCHDLDSRSYLQGHAYLKLCLGLLNSSLPSWILIIYHTNVSWPWLRVRSPRLRSKYTNGNFFSGPLPFSDVRAQSSSQALGHFFTFVLSSSESVMMHGERYIDRGLLRLWTPSPVPFGTLINIYSIVETSRSTTWNVI